MTVKQAAALIAGFDPNSVDESGDWFKDRATGLSDSDGITWVAVCVRVAFVRACLDSLHARSQLFSYTRSARTAARRIHSLARCCRAVRKELSARFAGTAEGAGTRDPTARRLAAYQGEAGYHEKASRPWRAVDRDIQGTRYTVRMTAHHRRGTTSSRRADTTCAGYPAACG